MKLVFNCSYFTEPGSIRSGFSFGLICLGSALTFILPALCDTNLPSAPDYVDPDRYLKAAKQAILPPEFPWSGASEEFIAQPDDPFITPTEQNGFTETPTYDEVLAYLQKLAEASDDVTLTMLEEKTGEGRSIPLVIVSREAEKTPEAFKASGKPLVYIEAAIHPGEVSGKDAGLILLRDLSVGRLQGTLLDKVNLLFAPIVNPDGHERSGPYSRSNERGPVEQGWRTNARNHNLNRDFGFLETPEIRNVVRTIARWDPDIFIDHHETDGVNYQYDVTYCNNGENGWSPASTKWMNTVLRPQIDKELMDHGHEPFICIDANDSQDLSAGFYPYYTDGPRYSNAYGDVRQTPSLLIEVHALKPYKRRVLGSYIFFQALLSAINADIEGLKTAIAQDRAARPEKLTLTFRTAAEAIPVPEMKVFRSELFDSPITGDKVVRWTNEPVTIASSMTPSTVPDIVVDRPKAYYIPRQWQETIKKLRIHGVEMDVLDTPTEVEVTMFRMTDVALARNYDIKKSYGDRLPLYDGHMMITGTPVPEKRKVTYPAGSVRIPTDQDLGTLVMILLEPQSPDSYLQWGQFNSVMTDAEYIENYIMEPMAQAMLKENPELKKEFEDKLASDPDFAKNPGARLNWFYLRTPYADQNRYLYPVGRLD